MEESNTQLTDDEVAQLTTTLARLQPGFLPFDFFIQLARLTVTPTLELVPLRTNNGHVEVLLIPRANDDKFWPGELHVPGTIIRSTDRDPHFAEAFDRLFKNELKSPTASQPTFVTSMVNQTKRGTECIQVFYTEISGEPPVGTFYDVNQLPTNLLASQRGFIGEAIEHYQLTKRL